MATRFSFSKKQFDRMKRRLQNGTPRKVIMADYDLGKTTVSKISVAKDYEDYIRRENERNALRHERRVREKFHDNQSDYQIKEAKRNVIALLILGAAILIIAAIVIGVTI